MYIAGLPANERAERLAEIDCDLWEHVNDAEAAGHDAFRTSLQVTARCVRGAPADVVWRLDQPGTRWQFGGFAFATLIAAGFILGFYVPTIPDLDAPPEEISAFYRANAVWIVVGHAFIWSSFPFFLSFMARLRDVLRQAQDEPSPMPEVAFWSGIVGSVLLTGAFLMTATAAVYGHQGFDVEVASALYHLGGFTFHYLASWALAGSLVATALMLFKTDILPRWLAVASVATAVPLLGEATGAAYTSYGAQLLFLLWVVTTSTALLERDGPHRGPARI
ncbi:MAG: hypothetical protein O3A47_03160 [Chloroflexi bacterium]|nr:hypothetical protein [Chloroflexota bacterium]